MMPHEAGTQALVVSVIAALRRRSWHCVTAESCTGGGIAVAITDVAGSSDVFDRGFITYSDAAKTEMLGVDPLQIATHGAVSPEVAQAMVAGALARSNADCAVSVTGIAGPGGGSAQKPVGTVCFGWVAGRGAPLTETRYFDGNRGAIRRAAVVHALTRILGLADDKQ